MGLDGMEISEFMSSKSTLAVLIMYFCMYARRKPADGCFQNCMKICKLAAASAADGVNSRKSCSEVHFKVWGGAAGGVDVPHPEHCCIVHFDQKSHRV